MGLSQRPKPEGSGRGLDGRDNLRKRRRTSQRRPLPIWIMEARDAYEAHRSHVITFGRAHRIPSRRTYSCKTCSAYATLSRSKGWSTAASAKSSRSPFGSTEVK